jgi:hypothetical protein
MGRKRNQSTIFPSRPIRTGERVRERKRAEGWDLLAAFLLLGSDPCPEGYVEFLVRLNPAVQLGKTRPVEAPGDEGMPHLIQTLDDLCRGNAFWQGEDRELILDSLFLTIQTQRYKKERAPAPAARETLAALKCIDEEMAATLLSGSRQQDAKLLEGGAGRENS